MRFKKYNLLPKIVFIVLIVLASGCNESKKSGLLEFEDLNYDADALSPVISKRTMNLHHGLHYAGYVKKANLLIKENSFFEKDPYRLLKKINNREKYRSLYNNLGQALNHAIFFKSLTPKSSKPEGIILEKINKSFGSYENFIKEFKNRANQSFGSGWIWLVSDNKDFKVVVTSNADNPVLLNMTPLFVIDLWEHSYYLDYQNRRGDYIDKVLNNLINWEFVENNYKNIY